MSLPARRPPAGVAVSILRREMGSMTSSCDVQWRLSALCRNKMRSERSRAMFERLKDYADRINDQLGLHKASARSGSVERHRALGAGEADDSDIDLAGRVDREHGIFNGGRSAENGRGLGAGQNVAGPVIARTGSSSGASTTNGR